MTANELRQLYFQFFMDRDHKVITSASLIPDNDPSVLFTTAGMHPLIPYLLGEKHPLGKRLVGVQKCLRTCDIDSVGDLTHLTFFEMLGNWSLGDYFKAESIQMSLDFIISKLHIPLKNIAVTVFEGDDAIPFDEEASRIWKKLGLTDDQVFSYGRDENWWGPAGITGPCGPDTEIFYDNGKPKCGDHCGPSCSCGKYVEIWNNVFLSYNKNVDGSFSELNQKNVDTGMGFERVYAILNGKKSVYETDLFVPIIEKIRVLTQIEVDDTNERSIRIISDHIRASTFILGEPQRIVPANTEQGYILRRLIRRALRHCRTIGADNIICAVAEKVIEMYGDVYTDLSSNKDFILAELKKESNLFAHTLDSGLKKANSYLDSMAIGSTMSGDLSFKLFDTFGFPIEFTQELALERGVLVDLDDFSAKYKEHQEKSRQGAEAKFKGGMADSSVQTTKLHTATHLLNGALRTVLGDQVFQKGSNITAERLRFDFSFERKLSEDELTRVAALVNEAIKSEIDVVCLEMSYEKAKESGAIGVFTSKYGEMVKVYSIEGYSKEICGGPHVHNTRELESFTILKEESSSSGVRRIKAVINSKSFRCS